MTRGADAGGWLFVVLVCIAALVPVAAFLSCLGFLVFAAAGSHG